MATQRVSENESGGKDMKTECVVDSRDYTGVELGSGLNRSEDIEERMERKTGYGMSREEVDILSNIKEEEVEEEEEGQMGDVASQVFACSQCPFTHMEEVNLQQHIEKLLRNDGHHWLTTHLGSNPGCGDTCWMLSYLSGSTNDKLQAVINPGVCRRPGGFPVLHPLSLSPSVSLDVSDHCISPASPCK
ncbi:hypothetical protein MATL_G00021450 [Megalops atlanticus]|uniref:Uncharacterized protein n=1 Tax=Megalops atlanticus TaxID=7932 RepID=A0A9D3TFF8_MEGAT|nr:hypothetical protein MATL_G00021450 [Megalops atlanticus]